MRDRWRIVLDGLEPFEVTTNAWDQVGMTMPMQNGSAAVPLDFQYRIVHNACIREEIAGVPRSFQEFMLRLARADEVTDDDTTEELDPTQTAPLDT